MSNARNMKDLILSSAYRIGLFELGRLARRHSLTVLCYHRFSLDGTAYGAMPIKLFEKHLQYLKKHFHPISFERADALNRGRVELANPLLLTVDDGYDDFIHIALPVLKRYEFPATLFVTTRFVDGEIWLWPDVINHVVDRTDASQISLERYGLSLSLRNLMEKKVACNRLHSLYKKLPQEARSAFLSHLADHLQVTVPDAPTANFRPVTWDQLRSCGDLVEIGSHTLNHHILSGISPQQALLEVIDSKKRIENELQQNVISFSYPNGMQGDYSETDKENLKKNGYLFAVTCNFGFNRSGADPLELRRIVAQPALVTFAKEVSGFDTLIHLDSPIDGKQPPYAYPSSGIAVSPCGEETKTLWDALVSKNNASIFHRYDWKHVFENTYDNKCIYLMAERNGTSLGILPLVYKKSRVFGTFLVSLPYFDCAGISAGSDDVCQALLSEAARIADSLHASYVELRHEREIIPELPSKLGKVVMMLQLPPDPEQLWSRLKAKVRNQVRKALKENLVVICGGADLLDDFFSVYATNMRDLGSPSHRREFFKQILNYFPEETRIFCVRTLEKTIAAGFTISSSDTLFIPWASALRKNNSQCPNMLLYWSILKYACQQGFQRFSFGRSTPDEGTFHFKRQWGAEPEQLYWQYWLSDNTAMPNLSMENSTYKLPVRVWKKMPVRVTRSLGPRVIEKLA